MCLYVHKQQKKPIIADRDYLVFKILERRTLMNSLVKPFKADRATSPYRGFWYVFGKLYTVPNVALKLPKNNGWNIIQPKIYSLSIGLHSMRNQRCIGQWDYMDRDIGKRYAWFPAIIPKGSVIWYGDSGDVLSNKLIVFRDMAHLQEHYDGVSSVS